MMIFKTISFMLTMSQNEHNMTFPAEKSGISSRVNAGLLEVMV